MRPERTALRWWPHVRRVATWVFFAVVLWLIVSQARRMDWAAVGHAIRSMPPASLALAAVLAVASHLLYATFDLLGRHVTGHRLATGTVMRVTSVAYAFNLNFGAIVGSIALRYRLYAKLGLDNETITRVLGFSMLTNWLGYLTVGGVALGFGTVALPPGWKIDTTGLRVLGLALLGVASAYLALCATARGRTWRVRGHAIETPSFAMGALQTTMAIANWSLMAGVIWVLLQHRAGYAQVLGVLLVGAVAGVITHVPAGLGVLEAVFVALLDGQVAPSDVLAALLAYRALYYLLPLAVAAVVLLATEAGARRSLAPRAVRTAPPRAP